MARHAILIVFLALVALCTHNTVRASSASTRPVEKVIALLEDLAKEVKDEGKREAETYDKFAAFCKASTASKSKDITKGADIVEELSATIEEKTAEKKQKTSQISDKMAKQESLSAELDDENARCTKEEHIYNEKARNFAKALDGIRAAMNSLSKSKAGAAASSLLEVRSAHALADVLSLVQAPVLQEDAVLLQKSLTADPQDGEYTWHSNNIEEELQTLQDKYKKHKEEAETEWKTSEAACKKTQATLGKSVETHKDSISQLTEAVDGLAQDVAKAKDDLVSEQADLKDAKEYLEDLTVRCEDRAKDWDQRTQIRAEEAQVLAKALSLLKGEVKAADQAANKRALLLSKHVVAAPVVSAITEDTVASREVSAHVQDVDAEDALNIADALDDGSDDGHMAQLPGDEPVGDTAADVKAWLHGGTSFLQQDSAKMKASEEQGRREQLLAYVQQESRRLGSTALASLALRVAGDPFEKVKNLIQQLLERLLDESAGEATKKGFCDEQVGKAEQERSYNFAEARKLGAEVKTLQAKKDDLDSEVEEIEGRLSELGKEKTEAKSIRDAERKDNIETLKKAEDGLEAVTAAYNLLKDFYSSAAGSVLLQASPVDKDAPDAPEGAYTGKQAASKAVLGLLEVIISDFDRTLRKTEATEKKAASDFEELKRNLEADIASRNTKRRLDTLDSKAATATIKKKLKDQQLAMDAVDASLKVLQDLKPMCLDHGRMSSKDRTEKREAEIAALQSALCKLDTDGVEAECK
jgi:hypothetical protein